MIYVRRSLFSKLALLLLVAICVNAQEEHRPVEAANKTETTEPPLDPGPPSFQSPVNPTVANLPPAGNLRPRPISELEALENVLTHLPAQPVQVRRKFNNQNAESSAIAKVARAQEWARLFGSGGGETTCTIIS